MPIRLLTGASLGDAESQLSLMLREGIASPNVRVLAESVTAGKDPLVAIFGFVKSTFPYVPDPAGFELFVNPNRVVLDYYGGRIRGLDCDDNALLVGALCGSIGYSTRIALVDGDGDGVIDHAFAEAKTETMDWFSMDTTSSKPMGWVMTFGVVEYVYP